MSRSYTGTFVIHRETDKAMLLSATGDEEDAAWVPFSQVSKIERSPTSKEATITMSDWIAIEKGFA